MKKILIIIGLLASMISLHAEYNNIYLGPEVFFFNLNSSFKGVQVRGSKCFFGLKLGYAYLRPAVIYFGLDFLATGADGVFNESLKGKNIPQCSGPAAFVDYELRLGYPISKPKNLTTLFLCQGAYAFGTGIGHHRFEESNAYLGGGIRYRHACSPIFNPGINIKIFGSVSRDKKWKFYEEKRESHHGSWGGEIGIPLIWCFGFNKRGNFTLEPYFLRLDFSQTQNIYGTHFLLGYRF